jgi:GNAT superfamily N-acetyltransferase
MTHVIFLQEPNLTASEFTDVLHRSGLAERRPVANPDRIERMLRNADLLITARLRGQLIGVARALTDFSYACYLSDLAVDKAHQRLGIGRELLAHTHTAAGPDTTLILLAAPAAVDYYPHLGMTNHPSCWTLPGTPRSPTLPATGL